VTEVGIGIGDLENTASGRAKLPLADRRLPR
jgi:hypothetical protein